MTTHFSCPIPVTTHTQILLGHGSGGTLMNQLLEKHIFSRFRNSMIQERHDGAMLPVQTGTLAFSTDSYVVHPLIFPGGTIGDLAVNGTVNDLAMCGAIPRYLSLAFIIEEGLPLSTFEVILESIATSAAAAGVEIVTGDTKVVERGKGDGLFINTSGIGTIPTGISIRPANIRPGDQILVNGPVAAHGMAIMAVRDGLEFDAPILSDSRPLNGLVQAMLAADPTIRVMRDATRGGLSSALNELATACSHTIRIRETDIPIDEPVAAACELLGFDPLYVANEGVFVSFVAAETAQKVLQVMRNHPAGERAAIIGEVTSEATPRVIMKTRIGSNRVVDMLAGDQLPRIC
ncbi:MAG: hydrogenase expression/formation protein HypE [Bacteroidetes bacterium]|nr:hydrogenase expression/formation protein HypE [Bacteroidota bacterium]